MGGNALKNCTTRRYLADEYRELEKEVTTKLMSNLAFSFISPIKAYRTKESFGDMDVLVSSDRLPTAFIELINTLFSPKELVHNGNVISFEYKELQIDLIITKPEDFLSSIWYFAYNDLGNLLGRIAHSMGLKLGHDGLSYNWRVDTYQFKNVVLAKDWGTILPILGLSYERYRQGFDTIEDIFEFVVSSPFFNKDIYLLHNRNHASRVRDAKRKTYTEFLTWIETRDNLPAYPRKEDKKDWLPYLFSMIPGFEQLYYEVQREWDEAVEYKKRFNGSLVAEWTGLKDKELGLFMQYLKPRIEEDKGWVLEIDQYRLKQFVLDELDVYRSKSGVSET